MHIREKGKSSRTVGKIPRIRLDRLDVRPEDCGKELCRRPSIGARFDRPVERHGACEIANDVTAPLLAIEGPAPRSTQRRPEPVDPPGEVGRKDLGEPSVGRAEESIHSRDNTLLRTRPPPPPDRVGWLPPSLEREESGLPWRDH